MKRIYVIAAAIGLWPLAASALDAQALFGQIEAGHVASVESALALLPPALRSHYALVFRSRSLQQGSYAAPRAILFGNDARFIVSFNGDPSQRGYDGIETMEYDAARARFVYREISFPAAGAPRLSEPNPERCAACHGHPARPIWDNYPAWPGVYGQRYHAPLAGAEAAGLARFIAAAPAHPRYRVLQNLALFADPDTFYASARQLYSGHEAEPPNETLSRLLGALAQDAIVREIEAAPRWPAWRWALLASLSPDCGADEAASPERARFVEAGRAKTASQLRSKQTRIQGVGYEGGGEAGANAETLGRFRFLVERELGLPTAAWTLALEKDTYDFSAPEPVSAQLERRLLADLAPVDPKLAELASLRDFGGGDKYCRHLAARSRAATLGLAPLPAPQEPAPPPPRGARPPLVSRCIACHQGVVAPALPFADAAQLARRLGAGAYPRGTLLDEILYRLSPRAGLDSMPRGINLDDAEREGLDDYFTTLAARGER